MRGFLYTVIVVIIAIAFTGIMIVQNGMPIIPPTDFTQGMVERSFMKLCHIDVVQNINSTSITVQTGRHINIEDYSQVMSNFAIISNRQIKNDFEPRFMCGNTEMGFRSFSGKEWYSGLPNESEFSINTSISAVLITKNWAWSDEYTGKKHVKVIIRDGDGNIIFDDAGYVGEGIDNKIVISDGVKTFSVHLTMDEISIEGEGMVKEVLKEKCRPLLTSPY
ncbi:MAG: hypothetical protein ACP5H8_01635 [Candidatus Micrarchaeia archaeon]